MKVLEVIPITRSIFPIETLSYFSTKNSGFGDLVKINFRNKETFAIVTGESDVIEQKASLKKIGFKLKPITSVVSPNFFSQNHFKIIDAVSKKLIIPRHILLYSLIAKSFLSKNFRIPDADYANRAHMKSAFRGSFEERLQLYKSLIRQNFAQNKSLLILAPSIESLDKLYASLGKGIEKYTFSFSSEITSKQYLLSAYRALKEKHPVLILGTYQALLFDRQDLETMIIEEEGSKLWHERDWLRFDLRAVSKIIAEEKKLKLIYSDNVLKTETVFMANKGLIEAKNVLTGRIQSKTETKIIKLEKSNDKFSWLSEELKNDLKESIDKNGKILLFANRKGYSSFTICQDCGKPQLCRNCSIPLVIHGAKKGEKKYICHHCLNSEKISLNCQSCNSWKLKDYGLGIEKITEEFWKSFPDAKSENVSIATESIFSKPNPHFDTIAIISVDNLFTIPDFHINESIFRLINALRSFSPKKLILQTRMPDNKLFSDALSGNISNFYQDEISAREKFFYPPFSIIIKLTREDKNSASIETEEAKAQQILKEYNPISFSPLFEMVNKLHRKNILIKIAANQWPDPKLASILENLSQIWEIRINPESII